jgi:hypothetical protein
MIIGIMQPYYLPYLGYFQLMKAVDTFVYYDDVTYIKQGWINRNNIIINGQPHRFTLELQGASSFKKINEIQVGENREKLYKTISQAYKKAPYFKQMDGTLYDIFHSGEQNLFNYILQTHYAIFNYLGISLSCIISSGIEKNNSLTGKDKVIDICKRLMATTYINAVGGQYLYDKVEFANNGIHLYFLRPHSGLPKTSIIDVMMNHDPEEIRTMLENYDLI